MAKKTGTVKKKVVKVEAQGMAHVHSTFNNVIITLTNAQGQVISWSSAGKMGFRGSKKNTPYAAQTAATDCAKVAYDMGLRKVKVYVKGPGAGPRVGHPHDPRGRHRGDRDHRRDAASSQRMPSAQPSSRVRVKPRSGPFPTGKGTGGFRARLSA